ncbi:macrolide ABC transporter permease [Enemella evansiae]|uniref:ABC transporter permease n=1 Tax=Enemella evansiae TaxID=2016499 RepID=UPI000B96B20A|nr:ABC transporter permease [Enemella evansiae]OYO08068.1 macrolide ABC transporter permease [Enemella evansiae]
MNLAETLRTAVESLWARKMRSILTMLGILIGIASVMLVVGLGQGATAKITDQINKLGTNLLIVTPGSATTSSGLRGGRGSATTLTADDAQVLADPRVAPDVLRVAPVNQSQLSLTVGTTNWTSNVVGTTPDWLGVRNRTVSQGRFFTTDDLDNGRLVAVLGATTAGQLFGGRNPIGQQVTANGQSFTVLGVLDPVGASMITDEDDQLVVPRTTFATRLSSSANTRQVSAIYLEARDQASLSAAYQEVTTALLNTHGTTLADQDFQVSSQQSLVDTVQSTAATLTLLLASIAGIALLVGGIGVMNIMLVSVSERVREIGLRKALGATPLVILRQFLVEAGLLGLIGGMLGVGLGIAGALTLPKLLDQPVAVSLPATAIALGVSLLIGTVAGVYPASRAARLAPIDALRSE